MINNSNNTVLILGANSDVAKQCILQYLKKGFSIIASSRNLDCLESFVEENNIDSSRITLNYFDAADFSSHQKFYDELPAKPNIVIYAAGFLVENQKVSLMFSIWFVQFLLLLICLVGLVRINEK